MANMPSGSKRPHPDNDHAPRPRDWRDVHLRSPREDRSPRQRERERERDRDRRDGRDGRPRSREHERRRGGGGGHGRDRNRDRERERDRKDDRHRRDGPRKPDAARESPPKPVQVDGEKEEGEISPRNSPEPTPASRPATPPKAPTLPPAQSGSKPATDPAPPVPNLAPLPELELETASPPPVEDTLAARRARRAAILAKYSAAPSAATSANASAAASPAPPLSVTLSDASQPPSSGITTSVERHIQEPGPPASPATPIRAFSIAAGLRESASASPAPDLFTLAKEDEAGYAHAAARQENATQGAIEQSAAEYDPSMDRREDEQKRVRGEEKKDVDMVVVDDEEEEEEEDDVDDMFALMADEPKKKRKVKRKVAKAAAPALVTTTLDNAADAEGYYQIILGEQLDGGRYQVFSVLGKGMFANVVRARVLRDDEGRDGREVAIKITRSQETMVKAGQKEVQILNRLRQADPEDKKHIVRLERTFEHRGHLCLVFESLSMNLREVVKRFGHDVGLNIRAVRAYAHQLFLALSLLRKTNTIHADIKPDNILVNEAKTLVKLCDLGSAADAEGNEITPYLVSRFYRAPEIILGVPYDAAIDIWSLGCTLYELYTGKILFPGRSNNQMLLHMMELKGRFNSKLIKRAQFGEVYFDSVSGAFNSIETNRVTGTEVMRAVHISNPVRDIRARVMPSAGTKLKDDEVKLLTSFIDLLDKCLALDPAKRISPKEALVHPFIRG